MAGIIGAPMNRKAAIENTTPVAHVTEHACAK